MALDVNELTSFNEVEEIDENASSYDSLPLPAAGIHQVKVGVVEGQWKGKAKAIDAEAIGISGIPEGTIGVFKTKDGKSHLMLYTAIQVDEEGIPSMKMNETVSTMVDKFRKTSSVDTFLRVLTGQSGVGLTATQKIEKLLKVLLVGAPAKAEIEWEATRREPVVTNFNGEEKKDYPVGKVDGKLLNRMANFPTNDAGVHVSSDLVDDEGNELFAKIKLKQLLPING